MDRALISGVPEGQIMNVKQERNRAESKGFHSSQEENPALLKKPDCDRYLCFGASHWQGVQNSFTKKADKGIEAFIKAEPDRQLLRQ